MWREDLAKDILTWICNRILAPYVVNLDMSQVNHGTETGKVMLENLSVKKGALEEFFPVDVLEGHLGKFSLSFQSPNLRSQPVEMILEDVYLLVVPSNQVNMDEEKRAQAAKAKRLYTGERMDESTDSHQSGGIWTYFIAEIISNIQVTLKNIHIRYEDKLSVPGHPFSAGVTLAGFTVASVNDEWQPAFIESATRATRKLVNLQSLALYLDTDSQNLAGLPASETATKPPSPDLQGDDHSTHQFVLKPMSGEGRITVNNISDNSTPRLDVQLLFDEIGISLDDHQYRDVFSILDRYRMHVRRRHYRKYRPSDAQFIANRSKTLLLFAGKAILESVRERRYKWSWPYFKERRDDRIEYIALFQKKLTSALTGVNLISIQNLEEKLSYEDILLYRSIARSRLPRDQRLELGQKKQPEQAQGRGGWMAWPSKVNLSADHPGFIGSMTDEQRQQPFNISGHEQNMKSFIVKSPAASQDAPNLSLVATIKKGTFTLISDPRGQPKEILSTAFDAVTGTLIQGLENFEASVSVGGVEIYDRDGSTKDALPVKPHIVKIKRNRDSCLGEIFQVMDPAPGQVLDEPFLFVKFEPRPFRKPANGAWTVRLRHTMEIICHRGYVERVKQFFKPPANIESIEAHPIVTDCLGPGIQKIHTIAAEIVNTVRAGLVSITLSTG